MFPCGCDRRRPAVRAVIDAVLTSSTVTLTKLKDVVDALNWPKAYPNFFCEMKDLGVRADKWRYVLETAGFCFDGGFKLKTPLKYIKSAPTNIDAYLDYDLAEKDAMKAMALGGDGKVLVDRGYNNMRCTSTDPDPSKAGSGSNEESCARHRNIALCAGEVALHHRIRLRRRGDAVRSASRKTHTAMWTGMRIR